MVPSRKESGRSVAHDNQPSESTTTIVITLAITAAQTMSFILLTVVSRRSAFSADRLLSASLSSGVVIFASL
jgi:hypothetical protein